MTSYQIGQWTGEDWIARVFTLKVVPKRAPCDTLLYLWPKQEWVWANTVTIEQAATTLPAISIDANKVRVKLSLALMPYGRPIWIAREVGINPSSVSTLQSKRGMDRWQFMPSVEEIRGYISDGMRVRQICERYSVSRQTLAEYLKDKGTTYKELVDGENDRRAALGLPAISYSGNRHKISED